MKLIALIVKYNQQDYLKLLLTIKQEVWKFIIWVYEYLNKLNKVYKEISDKEGMNFCESEKENKLWTWSFRL